MIPFNDIDTVNPYERDRIAKHLADWFELHDAEMDDSISGYGPMHNLMALKILDHLSKANCIDIIKYLEFGKLGPTVAIKTLIWLTNDITFIGCLANAGEILKFPCHFSNMINHKSAHKPIAVTYAKNMASVHVDNFTVDSFSNCTILEIGSSCRLADMSTIIANLDAYDNRMQVKLRCEENSPLHESTKNLTELAIHTADTNLKINVLYSNPKNLFRLDILNTKNRKPTIQVFVYPNEPQNTLKLIDSVTFDNVMDMQEWLFDNGLESMI